MILAAGFGTRLKPITDKIPKALVVYKAKPLILHQIERLKSSGVTEIEINAHHFSEKLVEYFSLHEFGVRINVIVEDEILGTGGAVLNAEGYLKDEKYFVVINVDVDTNADLRKIMNHHENSNNIATIAVQKRNTSRYLEFNDEMILIGRSKGSQPKNLYAFNGIHIISNEIFNLNFNVQYCDIIDLYIKLSHLGKVIRGYDMEDTYFKDIGKPDNLI